MPIKDPKKLKAARQRADAKRAEKRAGTRHHEWTAVVYPESAPEDWRDKLDEHHIMWAESPLHDKDQNPDGTPKKPHWHIALHFDVVKSYEQVMEMLKPINSPSAKYVQSMRGLIRYFAHLDNPEKAQYDTADIKTHGGFDLSAVLAPTATEATIITRDIMRFIVQYNVREFAELVVYAMQENAEWFDVLNNHCYLIREFMKSRKYIPADAKFANPVTGEVYDFSKNELTREEHCMEYGHINTGESKLAYGEVSPTIKADLAARPELVELIARHRKSCQWTQGEPVEVFTDEGFPCIRYAGGNWWHYDTNKGTWF